MSIAHAIIDDVKSQKWLHIIITNLKMTSIRVLENVPGHYKQPDFIQ